MSNTEKFLHLVASDNSHLLKVHIEDVESRALDKHIFHIEMVWVVPEKHSRLRESRDFYNFLLENYPHLKHPSPLDEVSPLEPSALDAQLHRLRFDLKKITFMKSLRAQLDAIMAESGSTDDFDAATWLERWLKRPNRALGGNRPEEFLDTDDGRSLISNTLSRMQSGAYA